MRLVHWGMSLLRASLTLTLAGSLLGACGDDFEAAPGGGGVGGVAGSGGTGGTGGSGGSGGSDPCGGCSEPTPYCDTDTCVACLADGDCKDADAARCDDSGSCVACESSPECVGVSEGEVCAEGSCVECAVGEGEAEACSAQETCDLLEHTCVDVAPGAVQNCRECTNDAQCADGRCIPMVFEGSDYGYRCLAEPSPSCSQPFGVTINRASINGAEPTDYCGIEEDLATCEAVLALLGGWHCTGTDGMCSEQQGGQEVQVLGAVCEQVGLLGERCTYGCASAPQCPTGAPQNTCGNGDHTPPGWCGG